MEDAPVCWNNTGSDFEIGPNRGGVLSKPTSLCCMRKNKQTETGCSLATHCVAAWVEVDSDNRVNLPSV